MMNKNTKKSFFIMSIIFLSLSAFSQPVNDNCSGAIAIIPTASCSYATYTTVGATASPGIQAPGCANYVTGDVWFSVVVPASGHLIFDTQEGTLNNGGMAIYTGLCASLTLLECNDDASFNGLMPKIDRAGLTPASTVYVRFWDYGGNDTGTFGICVYEPNPIASDFCTSATPICNLNGYYGNTSSSYTNDSPGNLSGIFCGSIENNSWLSFVPDSTSVVLNIAVSNCSNSWGIQMQVYGTPDCNTFTSFSNCWNPGVMQNGSIIATGLTIGQTYYLMIDGWAGDVCDYIITASSGVMIASAGPDVTICSGQSTQLNASGGTTYSWTPVTGLSNPNIANPVATPDSTTTYTLTIMGGNTNCPSNTSDQMTVTVDPPLVFNLTASSNPICSGSNSILSANTVSSVGNILYNWSTGSNTNQTNVSPGISTEYYITGTDACGTVGHDTILVEVVPVPNPELGNDTMVCQGTILTLDAGEGGVYQWSTSASTQAIQTDIDGMYSVTVANTNGVLNCMGSDTILVTFIPAAIVNLGADQCIPSGPVLLDAQNPGFDYLWSNGATTQTINVSNSGIYSVTVSMGSGSICSGKDSVEIRIIPDQVLNLPDHYQICTHQYADFSAAQTNNSLYSFLWSDGSVLPYAHFSNLSPGIYTVYVTVSGCNVSSDTTMLEVISCDLTIPNVITPNGDGLNDKFFVNELSYYPNSVFQVYNRWGDKVYENSNYQNEWGGGGLADGTYFFILKVNYGDENYRIFQGTVTILNGE